MLFRLPLVDLSSYLPFSAYRYALPIFSILPSLLATAFAMSTRIRNSRHRSARLSRSVKRNRRCLHIEVMEPRVVLSANPLNLGQSLFDANLELHALTVLPNQAADPINAQETLSTVTPVSLAETFLLNSNPGASHTIYLDFDGHVTSNTIWNTNYNGGQDIVTAAYDFDGNTSSFADSELQRIQWIWERVAEDFIPFDVNVTTEDPGTGALIKSGSSDSAWGSRVVIGGSSSDWWGSAAGGVAYVGSFNWSSDSPAFVFEAQLGNGNEKYTAEAISHEVGHAIGLSHDGRTSPLEEYYAGQGSGETGWAPILGSGYTKNVTQWSQGEYTSASQTQDDLAIITGNNGFTYRADDHGGSNSSASVLGTVNEVISDWGIVERSSDIDVFAFPTNAGTIQIDVKPLDRGPNLDVMLELYDSANNLVGSSNPVESLAASISLTAAAGQYYLQISGTGKGDPATDGYSDYASLGQYFISGTVVPVQNDFVSISAENANHPEGDAGTSDFTFIVSRTGNTSEPTSVDYALIGSGSNAATASDFAGNLLPNGSIAFAAGETSKAITIQILGDTEVESDEGFTVTLSGASGDTVIGNASSAGVIVNDDAVATPGITVTPTSGLTTRESGGSASFTVVLDSRPTADVTIQVTSLDTTEGTVSTAELRFTSDNWDTAQTVTVSGVDDSVRDGNVSYTIDLSATQSNDANFDGVTVDDVQATNQDNEKGKRDSGGDSGGGNKGKGKPAKGAAVPGVENAFSDATLPIAIVTDLLASRQHHDAADDDHGERSGLDHAGATAKAFSGDITWAETQLASAQAASGWVSNATQWNEEATDRSLTELLEVNAVDSTFGEPMGS